MGEPATHIPRCLAGITQRLDSLRRLRVKGVKRGEEG